MTKATIIILIMMCIITGLIGGTKATEELANMMKRKRGRDFRKSSARKTMVVAFAAFASLLGIFRTPLLAIIILLVLSYVSLINKQGYETAQFYAWISLPLIANVVTHVVIGIVNGDWSKTWLIVFVAAFFAADYGKLRFLEFYDEDDAEEKISRYKEGFLKKVPLILAICAATAIVLIEFSAIMKGGM